MPHFFIRRPIVAMVIAILTVLIGAVSILGLPISQFPEILPPVVNLSTTYTGADALTVEQSVATPIEQQMNGVDRSLYIKSTNANDGTMQQEVTFDVGSNTDTDTVLAQNRFSQAQPQLPQDVKNYGVTIKKSLNFPLMVIDLYSPDGRYDAKFLGNYATINVNDALLRIRGVGDIRNLGGGDYAMRIWLKPDVLASLGLTVNDVQNAIRAQNVVNPAGQVGAEPAPADQQFSFTVRAQGRLDTPEQFGDIVVRQNRDGSAVRVRDVATVELGTATYTNTGALNGKPAAIIAAFQSPGSNALEVATNIRKTMEELKTRFPPGLSYEVALDTTVPVTAGIKEILITLAEAIFLVVLVVFVFLQNWRATLIPLLTVPVSLVGAFALFPLLGFSVNTLSLFGLVLAIGLVVDDAIVVVEAVEHHIEEGMSPRQATEQAMREVSGPVVAIALVLAAVFIPVAFLSGITGRLYQQFALTIAFSVLISAFNALSLSPALAAKLLRPRKATPGLLGRLGAGFNRWFGRMTDGYIHLSNRLARKLFLPLGLLAGVTLLSVLIGGKLPTGFVPQEDNGYAIMIVQLPDAASMQRTQAVFKKVEAEMARTPGVRFYTSILGYNSLSRATASYFGTMFIGLQPYEKRTTEELQAPAILRRLNAKFASFQEARVIAIAPSAIPGLSSSGGLSIMIQDRSGGPVEFLAKNVQKYLTDLRKRPEVQNVIANFSPAVPQLFAEVNRDKALKQGVPIADVYAALQAFLGGSYVNDFTRFGRQWRVYVQSSSDYRRKAEDMKAFYVRNGEGTMVPLSSFVTVRETFGPEYTVRFNLYRAAEVVASPAPGYSSGQALVAMEEVARALPPEVGFAWYGPSYQEKVAEGGTAKVLGLSLIFVFLILAALYESWSLPFSVLLGTPIAVLGAYLGLVSRSFDNNVYAQIGLVMLVGLTAKNAILIVEFAKAELDKGKGIIEAALTGARLRLRPILMTSFAFIFGCLPLLVAEGAGSRSRQVIGTVVVAGMLAATLLGVFIIPALFVFVERLFAGKAHPVEEPGPQAVAAEHPDDAPRPMAHESP